MWLNDVFVFWGQYQIAIVKLKGKWGYIDENGIEYWED